MHSQTEQSTIPVIVNIGSQIGKRRRRRILEVVKDLNDTALFRDKHSAVRGEFDHRRIGQPRN